MNRPQGPTIQGAWELYETEHFDTTGLDMVARSEARRAFFAGGWTVFKMLEESAQMSPVKCGATRVNIIEEVNAFCAQVLKGEA